MKLAETKIAKQLSGYILIQQDLEFARQAFLQASKIKPKETAIDIQEHLRSAQTRFSILDPLLRRGGTYPIMETGGINQQELTKCALFEAGLIAYARCFNRGLRTGLNNDVFKNGLADAREVHDFIMDLRNKHVAHSCLERESSIVGFENVVDENYGKRPSTLMTIIASRIHYPDNEILRRLADHCDALDVELIQPKIERSQKALREELLKLSPAQIESMTDFLKSPTNIIPMVLGDSNPRKAQDQG